MSAVILVGILQLVVVAGCARGQHELDGTQWRLTEWTLSSLSAADFDITARFADGQVSGRSGVNNYGGSYRAGADKAFSVGPLASTEMAGPEPAMRAEGAYLLLLEQARSYRLVSGRLTLLDAGGNVSLVFEATGSTSKPR